MKNNLKTLVSHIWIFSTVFAVSCCTLRWNRDQSNRRGSNHTDRENLYKAIANAGDVRADLQLAALVQADAKNAASMIGLFSEAGYVDGGQTVIFEFENGSGQLIRTDPGSKEPRAPREMTSSELQDFKKSLDEFKSIGNYDKPSFDGVRFELIRCQRPSKDEPLKLEQRVRIMTLQDGADSQPFRKLLAIFDGLNGPKSE